MSSGFISILLKFISFFLSWAEQDVDPSLFSKELMANASRLVDDEEVTLNLSVSVNLFVSYSSVAF